VVVGVLLDTFVVRTLLVPALAVDLGARGVVARPAARRPRAGNPDREGLWFAGAGIPSTMKGSTWSP
jgi:hypothetical protein